MSQHVDEVLPELALDHLDDEEKAEVLAHLSLCHRCANELALMREALALLNDAIPPLPPPAFVRERLLDAVTGGRFAPLLEQVAGLLGLGLRRVGELLGQLDRPEVWGPGPAEGICLFAVEESLHAKGENFVGFVKIEPGVRFPPHRHAGEERVLVLQGAYRDASGEIVRAGEQATAFAGTEHYLTALEGVVCIGVAVNEAALEFLPSSTL